MTDTTTKSTIRRTLDTIRACAAATPNPRLKLAKSIEYAAKQSTLDAFLAEVCTATAVPLNILPDDIAVGALMAASAPDAAKVLAYIRERPHMTATTCIMKKKSYDTVVGKIEREVTE